MEMTPKHRAKTGAYYTPEIWADLAVKYLEAILPLPLEAYVFYDPACGEGALLEAIRKAHPTKYEIYGTTLEAEDVEICRQKGFKAWQYDFLKDDDIYDLPHCIIDAGRRGRLVVLTNPPYFVVKEGNGDGYAKEVYGYRDASHLFIARIIHELYPSYLALFSKTDILQAPSCRPLREDTLSSMHILKASISNSKTWGLRGEFPILFSIWERNNMS